MGLDRRVHLTGYLAAERASAYLTGSDLGVLPFNHGVTGKSGALLAMLAHGLPIVATRSSPPGYNPDRGGNPATGAATAASSPSDRHHPAFSCSSPPSPTATPKPGIWPTVHLERDRPNPSANLSPAPSQIPA